MDNDSDDFPGLRNSFDLNSRIMLTAIVSLSAVVLLVIALHVYARCVLRRQARRRRLAFLGRIHSLGLTTSDEPPKTGLDPVVINSLPMFLFKQITTEFGGIYNHGDDDDGGKSSMECSVCLSMLEGEEMARLLPNCKHVFHAECIDKWLASHSTCPLCRIEAEPPRRLLQPEPREGPATTIVDSSAAASSADDHQALDMVNSSGYCAEGTTDGGGVQLSSSAKIINGGSSSRLSSFQRILTRERSMSRVQSCEEEDEGGMQDLERQ